MYLQENTLFVDLDLWVKARYPLCHVTYSGTKFKVATFNGLEGDIFTRKYIISLFDL